MSFSQDTLDLEYWTKVASLFGARVHGWTWRHRATLVCDDLEYNNMLEIPGWAAEAILKRINPEDPLSVAKELEK